MHRMQELARPLEIWAGDPQSPLWRLFSQRLPSFGRQGGMEDVGGVTEVSVPNIKMILKHLIVKRKHSSEAAVSEAGTRWQRSPCP